MKWYELKISNGKCISINYGSPSILLELFLCKSNVPFVIMKWTQLKDFKFYIRRKNIFVFNIK